VILLFLLAISGEAEFYDGLELERAGSYAEAVRVLEGIPRDDRFADEALAEIGRIEESKLHDPAAALDAYERLLRDHPESRLALRAQRQADELRMLLRGTSDEGAREWTALQHDAAPRVERIAGVGRFLGRYPDSPVAPQATLWLATLYRDEGRDGEALARARAVVTRWPDTDSAARARALIDDLLRADDTARLRARLTLVAWLVLAAAALAALLGARGLRPLLRAPVELVYLLPVAALFVGAGLTENRALGHAIEIICAGGLAVTWLSGAALESARARGPLRARRVAAHIAVSVLAVLAVCTIAVTRERLVDQLVETIRYGADR
jgi:tetratricopeptide (TPR) repeat protein